MKTLETSEETQKVRTLIRTWKLSYDLISKQKPRGAEMLSLMAYLDRQGIPKSLLRNPADRNIDIATALGILQAFSLISAEDSKSEYEVHRLVQLATQRWLELQGTKEEWQKRALLVLADMFPPGDFENWTICESLMPHAQTVIQHEYVNEACPEQFADLLVNMARFDMRQGRYGMACTRSLTVFRVREKLFGLEHPKTLTSMANLALTYVVQGRWDEAEKLQTQVMKTQKRVLEEEHPNTLNNMDEAEKLEVQVVIKKKRVLGEEHPDTLVSMANLALMYMNQGRLNEAEKLQMQVIKTRKRVLGEEHPDTLTSMNNLAFTYWGRGRHDDALELMKRVVDLSKKTIGPSHPDTLKSVRALKEMSRTS